MTYESADSYPHAQGAHSTAVTQLAFLVGAQVCKAYDPRMQFTSVTCEAPTNASQESVVMQRISKDYLTETGSAS